MTDLWLVSTISELSGWRKTLRTLPHPSAWASWAESLLEGQSRLTPKCDPLPWIEPRIVFAAEGEATLEGGSVQTSNLPGISEGGEGSPWGLHPLGELRPLADCREPQTLDLP